MAMLIPLVSSSSARADVRKQVRESLARERHLTHDLRRIRRLIERLKIERRELAAALDASRLSLRGVESAAMLELWRGKAVVDERLADAKRAVNRMGRLRLQLQHRVLQLRIALTHLFRVCPVDEPRSYVDDFGVLMRRDENGVPTKDMRQWHRHQGIDIFSVTGTPVRAPFTGWARMATNPVGGLAVKVFGAQGFVYNAHLTAYGHLGYVEEGTIIGYVGNTGDARGTMAHDHFEWHPGNGPAVDPYSYLNEACL
jgi:murein DD-endopeptidase MepM/ murein hydrolase activator NlpD